MASNIYWGAFVIAAFDPLYSDNLHGTDYKILFYLLSNINYNNNVSSIKQKDMSEELSIHKTTASKSLRKLEELQYIAKFEKYNGYMINPTIFYVGKNKSDERDKLRDEFDELVLETFKEVRFELYEFNGLFVDNYKNNEIPMEN